MIDQDCLIEMGLWDPSSCSRWLHWASIILPLLGLWLSDRWQLSSGQLFINLLIESYQQAQDANWARTRVGLILTRGTNLKRILFGRIENQKEHRIRMQGSSLQSDDL